MSYKISYTPEDRMKYPLRSYKQNRVRRTVATISLLIVILAILLSIAGNDAFDKFKSESILLAEDAVTVFSDQIEAGETVYNALHAYCKYIVENANG